MGIIVPAVLPSSYDDLEHKLRVLEGLVSDVQIDIVDGVFADPPSWPYDQKNPQEAVQKAITENSLLPGVDSFKVEMDIMVQDPETIVDTYIRGGATRITLHAESTKHLPELIQRIRTEYGHDKDFAPDLLSLGLAISANTDLSLLYPYIDELEYVQLMGIKTIGRQGQPFDTSVLRKIKTLRTRYPDLHIQVDGAVSLTTAPELLEAGVSRLVVGSALWKGESVAQEVEKFKTLTQRYGAYE